MTDVFRDALERFKNPTVEGYEILRLLGDGGQARVYLARADDGSEVAIKRWLDADVAPEVRERVRSEAEALEQLDQPNLVSFLESVQDDEGAPCLVMEFVDGVSLAELIRQAGRLEPERAAEIGAALAEALAHVHALGLVHRDVKPSNVLIRSKDKQPVLIDLGIVTEESGAASAAAADTELTLPGRLVGSYPYMSPEQLSGEAIDGRADLYGLGALLFEAVTGYAPWGDQGPWVRRHRDPWEDPVFPEVEARARSVPPHLRRIVARCMRGEVALRYADAGALRDDLLAFVAGRSTGSDVAATEAAVESRLMTLAFVRPDAQIDATQHAAHAEHVRACIERSDGIELSAEGSEFCVSFEAPSAAVAFGLRLCRTRPDAAPQPHVAVELGEVSRAGPGTGLRFEGSAVDVGRRLCELAQPSQLLMSAWVFDQARARLLGGGDEEVAWRAYGPYRLGGAEGEVVQVCEAGYPSVSPLTPPAESDTVKPCTPPGHEAVLGWRPAGGLRVPKRPNWRLSKKLGEGGFGEVWLATHTTTRDKRAFKFCFHADRLRQLKREVILFTVLRDTLDKRWDIAQLLDWQFEEAPFFIESEYSPNGSFLDWAAAEGGLEAIPFEQRIELVAQVADALGAAHRVGVLHKDVKPSNVLIKSYGVAHTAQLADFGVGVIARDGLTTEVRAVSRQITSAGATEIWAHEESQAFSRLYMAPELIEGQPASALSDIYSLGVLLYQVVRGDFSKALGTGWERTVDDPLLREDIAACVDHEPARRLENAEELGVRLRNLDERRADLEVYQRESKHRELLERTEELVRQRNRWLLAVLLLTLLTLWAFAFRGADEANALREQLRERDVEVQELRQRVEDLEGKR